ncbi:unnamed protein product [Caenorhabditis sp. 36 PRJEB53466]|nr:unnamed protein product [Caenorhabditis sp. 36 PRJEB53466]
MLTDYLNFRIPSTGLMTSWCASKEPSHLIKIFFWTTPYFSYLQYLFPFLMAILRLVPIHYSTNAHKMNNTTVRVAIPFIFVYPLGFTWFLIPALGVCRQFLPPYAFGAVYTHYIDSWYHLGVGPFMIYNSTLWFLLTFIANAILYRKLRSLGNQGKSVRLQRAELTLTLTTISMLVGYIANLILLVMHGFFTTYTQYFVPFRSFGVDVEAVLIPWIVFLVHPAFKSHSRALKQWFWKVSKGEEVAGRQIVL